MNQAETCVELEKLGCTFDGCGGFSIAYKLPGEGRHRGSVLAVHDSQDHSTQINRKSIATAKAAAEKAKLAEVMRHCP